MITKSYDSKTHQFSSELCCYLLNSRGFKINHDFFFRISYLNAKDDGKKKSLFVQK